MTDPEIPDAQTKVETPLMHPEKDQPCPPAPPLKSWQCEEMASYYLTMANWLRARGL